MKLFNTLKKKVETFSPRDVKIVTLYCCGPTVYDYATIGNFRTYTMTDILVRILRHFGYTVKFVMNITDVGHLVSDADTGEDKMEKGAKREGKTAWDIAKFYTDAFLSDSKKLHLLEPDVRPKPTEHIAQQIAMVSTLLTKGFAYKIDDGIYYDTGKFTSYGELTGQRLDELKAGARVEPNPQKRNPTDFALWKFSPTDKKRDMEWESPWGMGFPGWHIECSAMSRTHLGDQIDIHTGGVDLIPVHHTNEIAQSEASSGKSPFVRYWVHGQFLLVDGKKMAKSKGNFYKLSDIEARKIDPLALRYFYMTAHYRAYLNFTWEALGSAQNALNDLHVSKPGRESLSADKLEKIDRYRERFDEALRNDMNMPQAIAIAWEVRKSNIPERDKYDLLMDFDEVLGLDLGHIVQKEIIPEEIRTLVQMRDEYRKKKMFSEADEVRKRIEERGFQIDDSADGEPVISRVR
jgi:cysteinyl-tRNA synthetase